jgi:arylformamidase
MGRIIDISMTIHEGMQVWMSRAAKRPDIANTASHEADNVYESRLDMDLHTGTHVDAPLHMLAGGETIETIALERLIGPARVIDLMHVDGAIAKAHLEPFELQRGERILLKTKSSLTEEFLTDFVYLGADGARHLIDCGVSLVGTDALGIERSQPDYPTHRSLMREDIVIVEGLRLAHVEPGEYQLVIAPLKLTGVEAAPARAFLMD